MTAPRAYDRRMRCLPLALLALASLALPAAADEPAPPSTPAAVGAHIECYHGREKEPIQKPIMFTKDVTCEIDIDQGEPPPSAKGGLSLVQLDEPLGEHDNRSVDRFVPHDRRDGIYYPFDPFKLGRDFKACKDLIVAGSITDGGKELWKGKVTVQAKCRAPRKLALVFGCHWDGDLVCVLQTKSLKTKIPADVVGRVRLGDAHVKEDVFSDYPDDTYAVEARFAKGDVPCTGASIGARAENAQGQTLFEQTITAPACP